MSVNLMNADGALKSAYLDVVVDHLNNSVNPFFAAIEHSTSDVIGKEVKKLVVNGYGGGVGAGTEEGELPFARGKNYTQFVASLKNLYGVIEISDKALRVSENNAGAFVNLLNTEMQGLLSTSKANLSRMLFGDGSGKLGDVGLVSGEDIMLGAVNMFTIGMCIDFVDNHGNYIEKYRCARVKSINYVDVSIRIDVPILDSEELNNCSIYAHNAKGNELTGLAAIFDTKRTSLYGVDKSMALMQPTRKNVVGGISEDAIQEMLDNIERNSGRAPNMIICTWGVRRKLLNMFSLYNKTFPVMEIAGGFKALSYNGIPIVVDRNCPCETMYFLNTNDFVLHQLCDWEWLSGEDGKILKQIPGKPVYTATLVKYAELICNQPNGQGVITGIIEN